MKEWTNEELIDQLVIRANQVGIISESNEIRDMREEVLLRMSKDGFYQDTDKAC